MKIAHVAVVTTMVHTVGSHSSQKCNTPMKTHRVVGVGGVEEGSCWRFCRTSFGIHSSRNQNPNGLCRVVVMVGEILSPNIQKCGHNDSHGP